MEKKSKIIIIVSIIIISLAVIISGIIFWYAKKWENEKEFNTPEEVSNEYFNFIKNEEYAKIYNLLSNESKKNITQEELENSYKKFMADIGCEGIEVSNIVCEKNDSSNSKITYNSKLNTIYGEITFDNIMELIKQDDKKYYINWNYGYIYPKYEKNDTIKIETKEAKRGNLLDRNGVLLAGNGYAASIGIVPGWMNAETKTQDIKKVSELLGITVETLNKKMSASYVKPDTFVELDTVSKQELTLLNEISQIKGIKIKDIESRVYPLSTKTAHITGYVQKANSEDLKLNKTYNENTLIGKTGLEKQFDERLRGKNGYKIIILNSEGNEKATILKTEKVDGENIKLTIDSNLQSEIYNSYVKDNSATVVMDSKTGELLALVSTPSYDPNKFVIGMSNTEWNELNNNPNNPLYTRFLKTYAPGSSFKPIIGAIALQTGTITASTEYEASGKSWQNNASWGSYNVTTLKQYNGPANLLNALINSDNIFFAKTALKIGADKLEEQLKLLGFESDIGFELSTKNSQISNNGKFSTEIQLADSGYGQGQILINPIHFASMYSGFANNGNMVMPYLEMKKDSKVTYFKENAFSKEVANEIKKDMIQTVESPEGTANSAKIQGITIAGKTGTAETKSTKEEDAKEIGWFNAFIADDNNEKQYLIISMIENVENKGGSSYVIEKVKNIFK